jgi:type II secretory pathway pseudopilin PulG
MSLIEVVIASALVLLLSGVLISVNLTYLRTANTNLKAVKAIYLAEEGVEAVNFFKNNNWNDLGPVGVDYYLTWQNSKWVATTTENIVDQTYVRKFHTESVNRDSNDDITLVGGSLDSNTRKLVVEVSWFDGTATTTKLISSYFMKPNE